MRKDDRAPPSNPQGFLGRHDRLALYAPNVLLVRMNSVVDLLSHKIEVGNLSLTPGSLLFGIVLLSALWIFAHIVRRLLRDRILPRAGLVRGVCIAISMLVYYLVIVVGTLVVLPVMITGFNLHTLSLMLGAISFGIGFGLRNIADNFVSGLILLIERPIKVGDRIAVGDVFGDVIEIKARATVVRTNDNIDIIVPNSEFISARVTNMTYSGNRVRFRIPVGVHCKSDVHVVAAALVEAARKVEGVLAEPAPAAMFMEFGESSLNFELSVWTKTHVSQPTRLRSELNYEIWAKLKAYGIEVPYPQRDIYIKEAPQAMPRAEDIRMK
jgi:small-conductance mechanosensitive channel